MAETIREQIKRELEDALIDEFGDIEEISRVIELLDIILKNKAIGD